MLDYCRFHKLEIILTKVLLDLAEIQLIYWMHYLQEKDSTNKAFIGHIAPLAYQGIKIVLTWEIDADC